MEESLFKKHRYSFSNTNIKNIELLNEKFTGKKLTKNLTCFTYKLLGFFLDETKKLSTEMSNVIGTVAIVSVQKNYFQFLFLCQ